MGAERAVKLVELLAAGGPDGQGQTEVFARATAASGHARVVPLRIEIPHNAQHGIDKPIDMFTHDFDGEIAGVLNQTVLDGFLHKKGLLKIGFKWGHKDTLQSVALLHGKKREWSISTPSP